MIIFIILQIILLLFMLLHDWIDIPPFTDIKALKEHHPDFLAHLYRRLDTGRANQIKKYHAEDESDQVIHNLGAEVKRAISYIKNV